MSTRSNKKAGMNKLPLSVPEEQRTLAARLDEVVHGERGLFIVEVRNYFAQKNALESQLAFILLANALLMWNLARPVTRLFIFSDPGTALDDVRIYAVANEFRAMMQGGFARLDNVKKWLELVEITDHIEPQEITSYRRAVELFPACGFPVEHTPDLMRADWYFGMDVQDPKFRDTAHFQLANTPQSADENSQQIICCDKSYPFAFDGRLVVNNCTIAYSSNARHIKMSLDASQPRCIKGEQASLLLSGLRSIARIFH